MPFTHRSPLDEAWGIRGDAIFEEMRIEPDRVRRLIDWCVDWTIQLETFMAQQVEWPRGWGRGILGIHLPDGAVWVNGAPVDLISTAMQQAFDRPFAERLFTTVGGGFFHHHALGVRQAAHVALTRGMLVQEIYDDINCPTTVEVLREGGRRSEEIVEASLKVPIFIHFVRAAALDRLLPIVKGGRFILAVLCDDQSEATESVRKVREASAG